MVVTSWTAAYYSTSKPYILVKPTDKAEDTRSRKKTTVYILPKSIITPYLH